MNNKAVDFQPESYEAPVISGIQLVSDSTFLFPTSGSNEEYGPSVDYGDEWI